MLQTNNALRIRRLPYDAKTLVDFSKAFVDNPSRLKPYCNGEHESTEGVKCPFLPFCSKMIKANGTLDLSRVYTETNGSEALAALWNLFTDSTIPPPRFQGIFMTKEFVADCANCVDPSTMDEV